MSHAVSQAARPPAGDGIPATRRPLPVAQPARAGDPGTLQCLRCQLLGARRLTCARADLCRELPHFYPLGPLLLLGWAATAAAFLAAIG